MGLMTITMLLVSPIFLNLYEIIHGIKLFDYIDYK
jgi:hypothetical protein